MVSTIKLLLLTFLSYGLATSVTVYNVHPLCFNLSCSTFSYFRSSNVASNATLILHPGNHTLSSNFNIQNHISISLIGLYGLRYPTIHCQGSGQLMFDNVSVVYIYRLTFFNGCEIKIRRVHSLFEGCTFASSRGVIITDKSNASFIQTNFEGNTAEYGGAIASYNGSILIISHCIFSNNHALNYGGAIYARDSELVRIIGSQFFHNSAPSQGGAVHIGHAAVVIIGSYFRCNRANIGLGGAVYIWNLHKLVINASLFDGNGAYRGNDLRIYWQLNSSITVEVNHCIFKKRSFGGNSSCPNQLMSVGVSESVFISDSTVVFHSTNFTGSGGYLDIVPSCVYKNKTSLFNATSNTNDIHGNGDDDVLPRGAITAFQSNIIFGGRCTVKENFAQDGGALHLVESKVHIQGEVKIQGNHAFNRGGGIYLYQSELSCHGNSTLKLKKNIASTKGGGIYAISSSVKVIHDSHHKVKSTAIFKGNSATMGGGIYLEPSSKLYVLRSLDIKSNGAASLQFKGNSAKLGGAVYVNDSNPVLCQRSSSEIHSDGTECFLQVFTLQPKLQYTPVVNGGSASLDFTNNFAQHGPVLFGGLLDRCTVSQFANVNTVKNYRYTSTDGVQYFSDITNINDSGLDISDVVSSKAVQVCFCKGGVPDCTYKPTNMSIEKGQTITVSLVAVDQVNHVVPNSTIRTALPNYETKDNYLVKGERYQYTGDACTDLNFTISTHLDYETLVFSPVEPCWDANLSVKKLVIKFEPCNCPIGFESHDKFCHCVCSSCLLPHITNCDSKSKTLMRSSNVWLGYVNSSSNTYCNYLLYEHCPLDYCTLPNTSLINMNIHNGIDSQCANNRIGLLCGSCRPKFTLSIGSSRCIKCPKYWPALLFTTILFAVVSGIVLIAGILVLNMTVGVGTLNGIIFYANIVYANRSTFLPFSVPNLITVFLAWINLDPGLDVCFFNGLDAYGKTWLQMTYPLFIIVMVSCVILLSKTSLRFSNWIGKKNPVATLATLILLSYMKLLCIIIRALSFAVLYYPDGSQRILWLYDGSIQYLRGKHIALFVAALFILLAVATYTLVLFCWQWLLHIQDKTNFKWIRCQRLHLFLEPYHAPYSSSHRYWTGLLLFVRIILYTIKTINVSHNPQVDLLAVCTVVTGLLFLKASFKQVYKCRFPSVCETLCFLNITLLCIANLYTFDDQSKSVHKIFSYASGFITLALFLTIVAYHMFTEVTSMTNIWKKIIGKLKSYSIRGNLQCQAGGITYTTMHTTSEVSGPSCDKDMSNDSFSTKFEVHGVSKFSELRELLLESTGEATVV